MLKTVSFTRILFSIYEQCYVLQHTFAVGSHSKATSLSRGMDIRQAREGALLDWYAGQINSKAKKGLFSKKLTPEMMLSWTQVRSSPWSYINKITASSMAEIEQLGI